MSVLQVETPEFMRAPELDAFRSTVSRFFERDCVPHVPRWNAQGMVDRDVWTKAGALGLLCPSAPADFGGGGGDFRHEIIIMEEMARLGVAGFGLPLHNAIIAPYITHYGSDEQKRQWLPRLSSGELVSAIAMTEPGAGSDLQGIKTTGRKDGNHYVINGQKTFISNGQLANFIIVVCKTDAAQGAHGVSLIAIETEAVEGFKRGRNLEKIGMPAQDTSELFFDDVRVPTANLIGAEEGLGFIQLMQQLPQERLIIAIQGLAMMEKALGVTVEYVKGREAFGRPIFNFQNTQFKLAEAKTKATLAKVFVNYCTELLLRNALDPATASMAKYWVSDAQGEVIDECVQLHGGYGYMAEYPIAQMWRDARVARIYGGSNEIMKLLIARSL